MQGLLFLSFLGISIWAQAAELKPIKLASKTKPVLVVFVPDFHGVEVTQAYSAELEKRSLKREFVLALEGVAYEAAEKRAFDPYRIGIESDTANRFVGILAYYRFSQNLKAAFEEMEKAERIFVLTQILALLIKEGDCDAWKSAIEPEVLQAGAEINPQFKKLYELLNVLRKEKNLNQAKFETWISENLTALESLHSELGSFMTLGARYILNRAIEVAKKRELKVDFESAVRLLGAKPVSEEETSKIFAECDGSLRNPILFQNIVKAYEEAASLGKPLYVIAGAAHIRPFAQALRESLEFSGAAVPEIRFDSSAFEMIDLSQLSAELRAEVEKYLADFKR